MTDREIIREQANIDISNLHIAQEQGIITEFGKGKLEALEGIVDFIDYLQEKPVSEDLEEAASRYAKEEYDYKNPATLPDRCRGCYAPLIYAFKAGAKWKEEQIMKDAIDAEASYTMSVPCITISLPLGVNVGDKVKVIIIKKTNKYDKRKSKKSS